MDRNHSRGHYSIEPIFQESKTYSIASCGSTRNDNLRIVCIPIFKRSEAELSEKNRQEMSFLAQCKSQEEFIYGSIGSKKEPIGIIKLRIPFEKQIEYKTDCRSGNYPKPSIKLFLKALFKFK